MIPEDGGMTLAVLASPVMLVAVVGVALLLDRRSVRKQERKQAKQRPLVPDFTKTKR